MQEKSIKKDIESWKLPSQDCSFYCPVMLAMNILGGKWKIPLLWHLIESETLRYGELKRTLWNVTDKMLIQSLRELESDNIIMRHVEATVPPKVSYSLTKHGKEVESLIRNMQSFGENHRKDSA